MVLGCRLDHLRGQNVLVNGNTYRVGENGIVTDISDADGWKLLAGASAWYRVGAQTGDSGPIDPTRELDTPEDRIPRDAEGKLIALELPAGITSVMPATVQESAQDKTVLAELAAYAKRHPNTFKVPTAVAKQVVAPSDANAPLQQNDDSAERQSPVAASAGQVAAPGAGNMPGIPPVEAPDQSGLPQDTAFEHAPDGAVTPVKKKRGRPPRKKEI